MFVCISSKLIKFYKTEIMSASSVLWLPYLTGAGKKSTASSESKALLQSKLKADTSHSAKLDSQKKPAIVLPSFRSKDAAFSEGKPDIKQENEDFDSQRYVTFTFFFFLT